MEFLTLLIALGAAVAALIAQSKLTDLKMEVGRLRRDLENALRLKDFEAPKRQKTQFETAETTAAKPAALTKTTPQKLAPQPGENTDSKPVKPKWAKTSSQPKPPARTVKPRKSFEEAMGAQWSVWVGGLALFLGAVFLLRYSIEAGVFTPVMRVIMASVFGVLLLAASEALHRLDSAPPRSPDDETSKGLFAKLVLKLRQTSAPQRGNTTQADQAEAILQTAYIPGILAAVGVFALLGAVYASYALYGFLSPIPAFVLLGLLSLGAMALSLRHGPILAALGLAASLSTPLLVQTETPNVYLLYGYLIIIASAAIFVAQRRNWGWLLLLTLASLLGWSVLSLDATHSPSTVPVWYGFLGLSFLATCWLAKSSKSAPEAPRESAHITQSTTPLDWTHTATSALIWGVVAAVLIVGVVIHAASGYPTRLSRLDYILALLGSTAFFTASFFIPAQKNHVFAGAVIGAMTLWTALEANFPAVEIVVTGFALCGIVMFLLTRTLFRPAPPSEQTSPPHVIFALAASAFPLALFGIMHAISAEITDSLAALIFITFTAVMALLAFGLRGKIGLKEHGAVFAMASALFYILAAALAFDGLMLTLALLCGFVIAALVALKLGDKILRIFVPAFAALSAAHSLLIVLPDAASVSSQIIFNELWVHFALPAVLCACAAFALEKQRADFWTDLLKALALAFAALFVVFQIRHIMNGGEIFAPRLSFDELALQVLTGLCFTLGGAKLGRPSIDPKGTLSDNFLPGLMAAVSLLTLAAFAFGLCLVKAPLFNNGEPVSGNLVLNSLSLGYLLPALFLAAITWRGRTSRPEWYMRLSAALCGIGIVFFVTSMVRFAFVGNDISLLTSLPKGYELYAISAAWLSLGIGALIIGMKVDRQDVRLASAALITLTVLKAFLIDMASLEGVLRAMSFVVLGLVLIVIGRVYQRVLIRPKA